MTLHKRWNRGRHPALVSDLERAPAPWSARCRAARAITHEVPFPPARLAADTGSGLFVVNPPSDAEAAARLRDFPRRRIPPKRRIPDRSTSP